MGDGCPFPAGGAGLPSRAACGEGLPPSFSLPQSRGPSLPPSSERRVGGLAATSLAPCAIQPRPHASGSRSLRSAAGRVSSPQCLVSPGPLRPPCCGRVCAPGVAGAELRSLFPSGSGVCMGESSFHDATGRRCGGRTVGHGSPRPQLLVGLPAPGVTQVITGKENCFKKLPC